MFDFSLQNHCRWLDCLWHATLLRLSACYKYLIYYFLQFLSYTLIWFHKWISVGWLVSIGWGKEQKNTLLRAICFAHFVNVKNRQTDIQVNSHLWGRTGLNHVNIPYCELTAECVHIVRARLCIRLLICDTRLACHHQFLSIFLKKQKKINGSISKWWNKNVKKRRKKLFPTSK